MRKENVQNNGLAEEQTLLGHQHMKAGEVKEAAECYQRAATLGCPEGQYALAECYEQGLGVKKDVSQAFRWTAIAANRGHPKACACMGKYHEEGSEEVEGQNLQLSLRWFKKAVSLGYPAEADVVRVSALIEEQKHLEEEERRKREEEEVRKEFEKRWKSLNKYKLGKRATEIFEYLVSLADENKGCCILNRNKKVPAVYFACFGRNDVLMNKSCEIYVFSDKGCYPEFSFIYLREEHIVYPYIYAGDEVDIPGSEMLIIPDTGRVYYPEDLHELKVEANSTLSRVYKKQKLEELMPKPEKNAVKETDN